MKVQKLSINDALLLYDTLRDYFPDFNIDTNVLEFIQEMIDSIRTSDNQRAYTDAIYIMTGLTLQDLLKIKSESVLELFVSGLIENKIFDLILFCREIGL